MLPGDRHRHTKLSGLYLGYSEVNHVTSCRDTVAGYIRSVLCLSDFTSEWTPWTRRGSPGFASPICTYRQNLSKMRESNDPHGSEVTNLCSLGVVDLDLSLCPDVFGLNAFDENMPITRMLPGSSPCELRLLLPDTNIGKDGFHDVVVENLIGSSTWRLRHVTPSYVIALRRRWPGAVFQVMKERSTELSDLRRQAFTGLQWAYRYAHPGYCPECKTRTDGSLESHMMCCHLGLGQLWCCPVEWCAVWKGSV